MKYALAMAVAAVLGSTALARQACAADAGPTVNSHTIFLNNCQPNGCVIHSGNTNATSDTSDLGRGTVAAFSQSAAIWMSIVSCMRGVMSRFDLTVTDQRPASGDYFEVVVAGMGSDIGISTADTGNTADFPCFSPGMCESYIPDALAFTFANESFYVNNPDAICGAAAQAIALTWGVDHVVDASDVMSYNPYSGVQAFHDGEVCGSDCVGGLSPFGLTCHGSGGNATHTCRRERPRADCARCPDVARSHDGIPSRFALATKCLLGGSAVTYGHVRSSTFRWRRRASAECYYAECWTRSVLGAANRQGCQVVAKY